MIWRGARKKHQHGLQPASGVPHPMPAARHIDGPPAELRHRLGHSPRHGPLGHLLRRHAGRCIPCPRLARAPHHQTARQWHHGPDAGSIIRAALDLASSARPAPWQANGLPRWSWLHRPGRAPAPASRGRDQSEPPAFWHCGRPLACGGLAGFRARLKPMQRRSWPGQRTAR